MSSRAKSKVKDKRKRHRRKATKAVLTKEIQNVVPESSQYMYLLELERRLDMLIDRKRRDIHEALRQQNFSKRTLRIYVSHRIDRNEAGQPEWKLRIEGRLLDDPRLTKYTDRYNRRKFSSFVQRVIVEFKSTEQKTVEWLTSQSAGVADGFEVTRTGTLPLESSIFIYLDYQPPKFKMTDSIRTFTNIHTATKPTILRAIWEYIKEKKLQDKERHDVINSDPYLERAFGVKTFKLTDLPSLLTRHLLPPEPVKINYTLKKTEPTNPTVFDVELELEDSGAQGMQNFLLSTDTQRELSSLDDSISSTIKSFDQVKQQRDFFLKFADDPKNFLLGWIESTTVDDEMRRADPSIASATRRTAFYQKPWTQDAVYKYLLQKAEVRRQQVEQETKELNSMS